MNFDYITENAAQSVREYDRFTPDRYRQFYSWFPTGARMVLDLGCSTGRGGRALKDLQPDLHVYGLDCLKDHVEKALSTSAYDDVAQGLSTELPWPDGYFDVVVSGEFIEHLYPHDVDKTMWELFRVLSVGGRLLLTTPNPHYVKLLLNSKSVLGGAHVSQHFPKALKQRLRLVGFSHVRQRGSGKVTWILGKHFPLCLYGSYISVSDKK